jgi:hypothetical protein
MLRGIEANPIIVGAYTNSNGICPMLAAHRNGGRTDFITFAKAWDRFAFRGLRERRRKARPATERELRILKANLEASLLADDCQVDLAAALSDHRRLLAEHPAEPDVPQQAPRRRRHTLRPGDPDRSRELRRRAGWRWMRVVRSYDDYEDLLAALDAEHAALDAGAALMRELDLQLEHS